MQRARVGIINVTSYMGMEVARLLYHHPGAEIAWVTGRSEAGKRLGEVLPHLSQIDLVIDREPGGADLVFSSLPHKTSAEACLPLLEKGVKVVDLSADFRLKDAAEYPRWYDFTHPAPDMLQKAVYGVPELRRSQVAGCTLLANPGCYPTGAILAMAPAVKNGTIHPDVIVDSKSGVSGAGRTLSLKAHFAEANESTAAYALEGHRHLPEIVQELESLQPGLRMCVTFLPHLVPMSRGILTSCYAPLVTGLIPSDAGGIAQVRQMYREFYRDEPFVKVVDAPPQTKHTWGTNLCLVYPTIDVRTDRLVVISCLDNLVKGGSGQGVQNMNLMMGFPETAGLECLAVYP